MNANDTLGEAVLSAQAVSKGYGGQPVLQGISLTVHEGERIGLIGRNGCGKSTLLKILAGRERPDEGLVTCRQWTRVGLLAQDCQLDPAKTVAEILESAGRDIQVLLVEYEAVAHRLAAPDLEPGERKRSEARHTALRHTLEVADAWNFATEIKRASAALDLPPPDRAVATLSGGELRRLDLAATILARPDVLLLDEPTNHIDTRSVEWIETFLASYRGSCILVTHDRYFLEQIVSRIVEIEFNRLFSFPGNYERFLEYKTQIQTVEAQTELSRQGILRRELAWLRRGAKARSTKQRARIQRYEDLHAQGSPETHRQIVFEIPAPPRLGKRILDAEDIAFAYGNNPLFKDFSLIVQKGMRIGLVGPNGCGKTTLLRVLMGQEPPRKGRVLIGETTEFLYVDQAHSEINPERTIIEFVSNGANYWEVNGRRVFVPAYLERFLFDRDSVHMPVRNLSGGERNRIELARKLLQGGNFLVLDEPTNDLDLPTLRVLEEAIEAFDGCALIVSHDRYFLNRLCTHLVVFQEGGDLLFLAGNYDYYLLYKTKIVAEARQESRPPAEKPAKPKPLRNAARLTYKEQQEFAAIESTIEAAETEVARLEAAILEQGFYEQPYPTVQETLSALNAARQRVDQLYARWQELERRQAND